LAGINVNADNPNYSSSDNILYNKSKNVLICYPAGKEGTVTIPNTVLTIGNSAFDGAAKLMGALTIPNSVTGIQEGAFRECSGLTSITIPNSVITIENLAFGFCSGLTDIYVSWETPINITSLVFQDLTTENIKLHVPYGKVSVYKNTSLWWMFNVVEDEPIVTDIASGYCGSEGDGTNLAWRLTADGALIISGSGAMENYDYYGYSKPPWYNWIRKIKTLHIGDSVTTIGDDAFYFHDSLRGELTIPNSIISLGNSSFFQCTGLSGTLIIPSSVTEIKPATFLGCSGFTDVIIPASISRIENNAFNGCSGLTGTLVIPNSVTNIGQFAFWNCYGLTSLIIGDTTSDTMFMHIEWGAFYGCYGLNPIYIGSSVSWIEGAVFRDCSGLTDLHVFWTTPISVELEVFWSVNISKVKLHVPEGTLSAYQNAPVWQDFLFGYRPINSIEQSNEQVNSLKIYPNPATTELFIDTPSKINGIEILDISGKNIKTFANSTNKINISDLPKGMYFIKTFADKETVTKKFIKK
jgi:hypothetical protein